MSPHDVKHLLDNSLRVTISPKTRFNSFKLTSIDELLAMRESYLSGADCSFSVALPYLRRDLELCTSGHPSLMHTRTKSERMKHEVLTVPFSSLENSAFILRIS